MCILLVHNPSAGMRQPNARTLVQSLSAQGHQVVYRSLAEVQVDEALTVPSDLVVVAGGDGTVAKVARRLLGTERLMTILPLGTANNIGSQLGFRREPARAIEAMGGLVVRALDVGMATGPWGRRAFFEGVGFGLLAHGMPILTENAHSKAFAAPGEKVDALRAALGELLRGFRAERWTLHLDGRVLEGELLMMEALNIAAIGPGLTLASEADPSDGLLDVVCVEAKDRAWLEAMLARRDDLAGSIPSVRAREVRFEWDGSPLHIDDEVWADEPAPEPVNHPKGPVPGLVTLSVEPGALRVLSPRPARAGRRRARTAPRIP
jgi:diacylglycerol kinase (ATP)